MGERFDADDRRFTRRAAARVNGAPYYVGNSVGKGDGFDGGEVVAVDLDGATSALPGYEHLWEHSAGFAWGYSGSGPAQLALALLAHAQGCDSRPHSRGRRRATRRKAAATPQEELAVRHHQAFKATVVARWPWPGSWSMSRELVQGVLRLLVAGATADEVRTYLGWPSPG